MINIVDITLQRYVFPLIIRCLDVTDTLADVTLFDVK